MALSAHFYQILTQKCSFMFLSAPYSLPHLQHKEFSIICPLEGLTALIEEIVLLALAVSEKKLRCVGVFLQGEGGAFNCVLSLNTFLPPTHFHASFEMDTER